MTFQPPTPGGPPPSRPGYPYPQAPSTPPGPPPPGPAPYGPPGFGNPFPGQSPHDRYGIRPAPAAPPPGPPPSSGGSGGTIAAIIGGTLAVVVIVALVVVIIVKNSDSGGSADSAAPAASSARSSAASSSPSESPESSAPASSPTPPGGDIVDLVAIRTALQNYVDAANARSVPRMQAAVCSESRKRVTSAPDGSEGNLVVDGLVSTTIDGSYAQSTAVVHFEEGARRSQPKQTAVRFRKEASQWLYCPTAEPDIAT